MKSLFVIKIEPQRFWAMIILGVISLTLLALVDWRIAIGSFLLLTAHQVEKHY